MWSARVLAKYWALQLPELAVLVAALLWLEEPLGLPRWLVYSLVGLWLVKDAALYPFLWRAYDPSAPGALHALEGERALAIEPLEPGGRVRVRGESWQARLVPGARAVTAGEIVRVEHRSGLTLFVAPADEDPRP